MLLYGLCFLVGGGFIFFAAAEGLDGVDFDHHFELDISGSERIPRQLSPLFQVFFRVLPLLSVRFWTFGVATFGLSGLLLQWLRIGQSSSQIFVLSLGIGAIVGSAAAGIMRWLQTDAETDSLIRSEDLHGLPGIVSIPFQSEGRGQVRLEVKGSQVYMAASSTEERNFQKGDSILVVGLEGNTLWVVSEDSVKDL
ncbi:MAG: NfeD-like protein [Prochlorotrichaceae cyanobacterium]|jgi:membrane protein implicated in regulation of membrane protease activity